MAIPRRFSSLSLMIIFVVAVNDAIIVGSIDDKFGSLTLCPAGGRSFIMAWSLACEIKKRRKRSIFELVSRSQDDRRKRKDDGDFRPATLTEIQTICCEAGCELRDLLSYCDPFGPWNSR